MIEAVRGLDQQLWTSHAQMPKQVRLIEHIRHGQEQSPEDEIVAATYLDPHASRRKRPSIGVHVGAGL